MNFAKISAVLSHSERVIPVTKDTPASKKLYHILQIAVVPLATCILSGCLANMTSIARMQNLPVANAKKNGEGVGTILLIDAKQRAIYTVVRHAPRTNNGDPIIPVFCAEPSPDALSSLAANGGISKSGGTSDYALNLALSEQAGSIGLRTQSIQLMRDMMFRECEAYIDQSDHDLPFMTLHSRLQDSMIAVLAIEQLTNAIKPDTVILTGQPLPATPTPPKKDEGGSQTQNNGQGNGDQQLKKTSLSPSAEWMNDGAAVTNAVLTLPPTNSGQGYGKPVASNSPKHDDEGASTTTSTPDQNKKPASDADAKVAVAKAVGDIVSESLNAPFTRNLCVSVLAAADVTEVKTAAQELKTMPASPSSVPLVQECFKYLQGTVNFLSECTTAMNTLTDQRNQGNKAQIENAKSALSVCVAAKTNASGNELSLQSLIK